MAAGTLESFEELFDFLYCLTAGGPPRFWNGRGAWTSFSFSRSPLQQSFLRFGSRKDLLVFEYAVWLKSLRLECRNFFECDLFRFIPLLLEWDLFKTLRELFVVETADGFCFRIPAFYFAIFSYSFWAMVSPSANTNSCPKAICETRFPSSESILSGVALCL